LKLSPLSKENRLVNSRLFRELLFELKGFNNTAARTLRGQHSFLFPTPIIVIKFQNLDVELVICERNSPEVKKNGKLP